MKRLKAVFNNKTMSDFPRAASVLSGILLALAYRFEFLWWLCLFALIPFCSVLLQQRHKTRRVFCYTVIFCLAYYSLTLLWLYELVPVLAPNTGTVGAYIIMTLAVLAVSLIMGLAHALPMTLLSRALRGKVYDCLLVSAMYISGELIIGSMGDLAFPWGRLANIAVPFLPFVQSAALFGSVFVSFIIVLINALLAYAVQLLRSKQTRRCLLCAGAAVLLFVCNTVGGCINMAAVKSTEASTEVLIVQGDFPSNSKWSTTVDKMLTTYLELSRSGVTENTSLVIWPETAIPVDLSQYPSYTKQMSGFTKEYDVTLVVGAMHNTAEGTYNVMQVIYPDGTVSQPYAKQLLVPMGEYTPFKEVIGIILPGVLEGLAGRDLLHGRETVVFQTPCGSLNGIICYESIQPSLQLRATAMGSELITMITNDSWFGTSSALRQHLSHARLRAVENGRYLVRSGNSGITAVIAPDGEITAQLETYTRGSLTGCVTFLDSRTPYSVTGDLPAALLMLPCIILFILDIIKSWTIKKCRIYHDNPAK